MSQRVEAVLGVVVAMLLMGCVHRGPVERVMVIEPRLVAGFGVPVHVDRSAHPDLASFAKAVLEAQWEDAFEFSGPSAQAGYTSITSCSALLVDEVSLNDVTPMHLWNTIQARDRDCRAAALIAESTASDRTDWPDQILTPAAPQQLPAEAMTRISRDQDASFAEHIAAGRTRWFQHEPVDFVKGDSDDLAEFVADGMRYWLSVIARADITGDGREDVLLRVASAPEGGSLRSYKLLVIEVVNGVWRTTDEWETRQ